MLLWVVLVAGVGRGVGGGAYAQLLLRATPDSIRVWLEPHAEKAQGSGSRWLGVKKKVGGKPKQVGCTT
jgi:hypothetical protein